MRRTPDRELGPIVLGCALSLLSGALITLSFAPHDAWPLVWIGFVPMAVAQQRILPPRLSALAPALGIGGYIAGTFGGVFPGGAAWYMKALPLLFGAGIYVSSRQVRAKVERAGYAHWPIDWAVSWVAVELVRSFIPALGTWGFIGYAMYRQTWFLQPVSVVGTFGLDLLIAVTNVAVALLVIALLDRRHVTEHVSVVPVSLAARWCAVAFGAVAVWTVSSIALRPHGGATVRIAALQPGRPSLPRGSPRELRDRHMLAVLSEQSRRASSQGAKVIVWPEGALASDPQLAYRAELASLARETGAYLFVGYHVFLPAGTRNEVLAVGPDGAMLGTYGKDHPVSFLGETSLSHGTYPTYRTPLGTVGAIICADIDFTDTPREMARRGAKLLAVPSADWAAISTMHYVLAVFRALETGVAVAKSEYSRDSIIVDGSGNIVASALTPRGSTAVLVADVAVHPGLPLAARLGDWVGWLCVAGAVVQFVARRRRRLVTPERHRELRRATTARS